MTYDMVVLLWLKSTYDPLLTKTQKEIRNDEFQEFIEMVKVKTSMVQFPKSLPIITEPCRYASSSTVYYTVCVVHCASGW